MNRTTSLGYLRALALLANATGCAVTTSYADEGDPALPPPQSDMLALTVPARGDVLKAWQLPPASPWSPYEKLTLTSVIFAAPELVMLPRLDDMDELRQAQTAARVVANEGLPPDAMWMIDLRGAASVAFGSALSKAARESVAVVPTFNNWPSKDELVPAEETLAAMISLPPRLPEPGDVDARPVFLLDSWRLAFKDETVDDERMDNRYMLSPSDFPSPHELLAHGISHVVYVVSDVAESIYEEDDLNALFLAYQAAGVEIHMVDLAQLIIGPEPASQVFVPWYVNIQSRFYVVPRRTVVTDGLFYRRAHGGFGGIQGVPIGAGHMFLFGGEHGGG